MATNEAAASAAAATTTAVEPEGDETELSKQEQLKLEEEKFLKLYGHKPTAKPKLRGRKWFDSGEYELRKQNPNGGEPLGVGIPDASKIPHSVPKSTASKPTEAKPSHLHASTASE